MRRYGVFTPGNGQGESFSFEKLQGFLKFPITFLTLSKGVKMSNAGKTKKIFLSPKMMIGTGLLIIAVGVSAFGAFSAFTSTVDTSASNPTYVTCSMSLAGIGTNESGNRLTVGVNGSTADDYLVPGDVIERPVTVSNNGTGDCLDPTAPIALTTRTEGCVGKCASSLLDQDKELGLQMVVEKCSEPWKESENEKAGFKYECAGELSQASEELPIIQSGLALKNIDGSAGSTNYLKIKLTFPEKAGDDFQNVSSTVEYAFAAQQRKSK